MYTIIILLILQPILTQQSITNILTNNSRNASEAIQWVTKILNNSNSTQSNKLLIYSSPNDIIESFISNNISVIINNDLERNFTEAYPLLIFLIDEVHDLQEILEELYTTSSHVHKLPVFVVLDDDGYIEEVFEVCKNSGIINVVVYYWSAVNESKWYISAPETSEILDKSGDYNVLQKLHHDTKQNSKGFQVKTCIFDYRPAFVIFYDTKKPNKTSGVDKYMMDTIMQHLNATNTIIKMEKSGSEFIEGRENLRKKVCDIVFVSLYMIPDYPGVVDLYPLDRDGLCFLVPKAKQRSHALNLIKPFQMHMWVYLILIFILLGAFWCCFFYCRKISGEEKHLNLLDLYGILLNLNLHAEFEKMLTSSRIFICSLTIYSFYITFAYQGVLVGFLINPIYKTDMNTLEDVQKAGLKIYGLDKIIDTWKKTDEAKFYSDDIKNLLVGKPDYAELIRRRKSNDITVGFIGRQRIFKFFLDFKIHNSNGIPVYHLMDECFQKTFCNYVVRRDFPFSKRIQNLIFRIVSAGLMQWWELKSKYEFNEINVSNNINLDSDEDNLKELTLSHLLGIFYCWLMGVGLSIAVFVGELVVNKVQNMYYKPKYEFIL